MFWVRKVFVSFLGSVCFVFGEFLFCFLKVFVLFIGSVCFICERCHVSSYGSFMERFGAVWILRIIGSY